MTIERYHLQLKNAMANEAIRDQLLLKPDQTHSHLLRSFGILQTKNVPGPVADKIFESMVVPFIIEKIFSQELTIQLVGSALPLLTKSPTQYLQNVVGILISSGELFERMISNEKYAPILNSICSCPAAGS